MGKLKFHLLNGGSFLAYLVYWANDGKRWYQIKNPFATGKDAEF